MSHASTHAPDHDILSGANIRLPAGTWAGASRMLMGVGLLGLIATLAGALMVSGRHAAASYLVAVVVTLTLCLGSMFLVMVMHLMGAGWSVTIRRQLENVMSLIPIPMGLFLVFVVVELASGHPLTSWLDPHHTEGDVLFAKKSAYLNVPFLLVRLAIYFGAWSYLARRLWKYSTDQDASGDRWISNKARRTSSWGMLVFALTVAFFGFDWLMAVTDFHFFSTMWGVYLFAGSAFSSVALLMVILHILKGRGVLKGAVGEEHFHDLGKLMFAFTVFWAYIAFSQYFLIWYSNIPEETAWYRARKMNGWEDLTLLLAIGHFILPFLVMIWRASKRTGIAALLGVWMLLMHIIDIFWIVRPAVHVGPGVTDHIGRNGLFIDIAAIVGVGALFAGLLVRRIVSGPLIPLRDPRLGEALHHKNYV